MHFKKKRLAAIIVSALALGATPALAADSGNTGQAKARAGATDSTQMPRGVLTALQRDLGLSAKQASKQGALQAKAIELDQALQTSLGEAFAGSSYDARKGKLVVMVSDAEQLDEVRAAGADARLVKHRKAQLEATKEALDVAAGKEEASGPANRQPDSTHQARIAGMTSWYIDEKANAVHVTVKKGQAEAVAAVLAKYGDAVIIEESDLAPTATVFMDGGDEINGNCSAGFNLRNASTGQGYLLTAGHCVSAGSTLRGQGGVAFGPVLESWPSGSDDAIARNDSGGYWVQGPWMDTNPSNGSAITVRSYTDAPVGTVICKSGITTRWTCGNITAKDETVLVDGITTRYGLTRHSACVEKGDSGGANVSVTSTYAAEGVTSAAQLRSDGSRLRCLSAFGQPNVSWYYPIADSLRYYGPKYGVTVW